MKKWDKALTQLALAADVANTLGGGMSEPAVGFFKLPDSHRVEVKIPGVKDESIKVEIHNNWLTIFHLLDISSGEMIIQVPRMVYSKAIPYFIDVEKIAAKFEDDRLVVRLPFNERANGYHRKISINQ